MRVIVPIKQILDPRGILVRRDKERVFINREEYIIDPASKAAIEAALCIRDAMRTRAHEEAEGEPMTIVAMSVGQPQADDALREALAMGCDEAYLLSYPAFKEADVGAVTQILAAAVRRVGGADLIIAGRESGDTGSGQIGPRLAEALGLGTVADVARLAVKGSTLWAIRRWGDGYAECETRLPAAVTVAPEAFPPRYAHGARIMNAYREWQVPVWSAADLGLDGSALTPLLAFRGESFPPPVEVGELLRGDPTRAAQDLVIALRMQRLVR